MTSISINGTSYVILHPQVPTISQDRCNRRSVFSLNAVDSYEQKHMCPFSLSITLQKSDSVEQALTIAVLTKIPIIYVVIMQLLEIDL